VVACLSPESKAAAGQPTNLWLDAERIHLLDAHDERRLTGGDAQPAAGRGAGAATGAATADRVASTPASGTNGAADAG